MNRLILLITTYKATNMRKGKPKKRILSPDPKYKNVVVEKFVNFIMRDGKKSLAYSIFYDCIDIISAKTEEDGLEVWKKALENITPSVEVKRKRIGGATFQIPVEVRSERKSTLSMKWLLTSARERGEKTIKEKLANEIIAASKGEGNAVKKKTTTHKMAESNKAFSHFRF